MTELINQDRVKEIFEDLLMIHSPSKKEKEVFDYCYSFLEKLGLELYLDNNFDKYNGNCPSLIGKLKGREDRKSVTLSAHLDVVEPNGNLKIVKEIVDGNEIWKSDGNTTLGGDDKAGVAAILYIIEDLVINKREHGDIFIVLTPGEEAGMLGAKNINWKEIYNKINPQKNMIVFDNAGDSNNVAYQAPCAYSWQIEINGVKAHAGIEPEKGTNSIVLASKIISNLPMGRIDDLTTANVSYIKTEYPSNVVPDITVFKGEIRSHDENKIKEIIEIFEENLKDIATLGFKFDYEMEYPSLKSKDNLIFVNEFIEAYKEIGVEAKPQIIGGGSDANFFSFENFNSVIIGVGMFKVHSNEEYLKLKELYTAIKVTLKYIEVL